jgi:hypothetical protein
MLNHHNVLQAEKLGGRRHRVTLHVPSRPNHSGSLVEYYESVANSFAYEHDAKVVEIINIALNPFRESATMVFEVKAYKHPEKHRTIHKFIAAGRNRIDA